MTLESERALRCEADDYMSSQAQAPAMSADVAQVAPVLLAQGALTGHGLKVVRVVLVEPRGALITSSLFATLARWPSVLAALLARRRSVPADKRRKAFRSIGWGWGRLRSSDETQASPAPEVTRYGTWPGASAGSRRSQCL